jgi:hypothetical protein
MQNAVKISISERISKVIRSDPHATRITVEIDVDVPVNPLPQLDMKTKDPSIIAHMKHEIIKPRGRSSVVGGSAHNRGDFKDAF